MAGTTRPGPHGTTMKPYGSFAGKTEETGGAATPIMMLQMNQYNGGMARGPKR